MTALIVIVAIVCAGAVITFLGTRLIERAYPPPGRFVTAGGLRQHVLELGDASGGSGAPPVVLLHGAGANLEDMRFALGEHLAAGHRLIFVDRPGFGWSERKTREKSSAAEQAAVLREVLDSMGVERAIVVGHSWGGTLALTFALEHPQRVAGLVLIAAPTHSILRFMAWHNAVLATPFGWLFAHTLALPLGALLMAPGVRGAFWPQRPPGGYLKRSAAWLVLRPRSLLANWADVADLNAFLTGQIDRYTELAAPTIAMNGDRDLLVRLADHAMTLAAAAPAVKVVPLAGVGHMAHYAAPDQVAAAVAEVVRPSSAAAAR